jgi:hypothetical protein
MIDLESKKDTEYPIVTLAIFIEQATPFFEEFLKSIETLVYPKNKIDLFVHNAAEYHSSDVSQYVAKLGKIYRSVKVIKVQENVKDWHARNAALDYCESTNCEWLFTIDSISERTFPFFR